MVESGNALCIMDNHEFNAVAWATRGKDGPMVGYRLNGQPLSNTQFLTSKKAEAESF
jgi:hypothetical protein